MSEYKTVSLILLPLTDGISLRAFSAGKLGKAFLAVALEIEEAEYCSEKGKSAEG